MPWPNGLVRDNRAVYREPTRSFAYLPHSAFILLAALASGSRWCHGGVAGEPNEEDASRLVRTRYQPLAGHRVSGESSNLATPAGVSLRLRR